MSAALKTGLEGAHALMGRVLRDGGPLADEYPLVFREGFSGRVVALGDGSGAVHSACAILDRLLHVGGERVRAGLIGSVSTAPEHRHRGLATRVLLQAERELRDRGCLFSLLWADDPRFYFTRGYRPLGEELDFELDAAVLEGVAPVPVRPAAPADGPAIHRLYERHACRVARTAEETAALLDCPGMKTLVVPGPDGIRAYGCFGRGSDLAGTLHEWSGPPDLVLGLARAHFGAWAARSGADSIYVMAPPAERGLAERLEALGASPVHGILGLGKLLDRRAGAELLATRLTRGSVELEEAGPEARPGVRVVGPRGTATLDDDTLLELLFPSRGNPEAREALTRPTGAQLEPHRRSPYVWGLDSI